MKIHVQHVGANRSLVRFYLYEHLFQLDRHHLIDQDCEGVFWYTYTGMHLVHRHLIYSRHLMTISFVVWFIILVSSRPFTQNSPPFLYTHVFPQKTTFVSVCVTSCTKNVQSLGQGAAFNVTLLWWVRVLFPTSIFVHQSLGNPGKPQGPPRLVGCVGWRCWDEDTDWK